MTVKKRTRARSAGAAASLWFAKNWKQVVILFLSAAVLYLSTSPWADTGAAGSVSFFLKGLAAMLGMA